jgi:hypothetical protein
MQTDLPRFRVEENRKLLLENEEPRAWRGLYKPFTKESEM